MKLTLFSILLTGTSGLSMSSLEAAEKLGIFALLILLVYILYKKWSSSEEKIGKLYAKQLNDKKEEIEILKARVAFLEEFAKNN